MGDSIIEARLRFQRTDAPEEAGEVVLRGDGTIQILPSPALRERLSEFGEKVDITALKWGSSALVGIATVGAGFYLKGWRPLAYATLALSGATGLLARSARKAAREWADALLSPHPLSRIRITPDARDLRFDIAAGSGPLLRGAFRLHEGEFSLPEAKAFLQAVSDARKGNVS